MIRNFYSDIWAMNFYSRFNFSSTFLWQCLQEPLGKWFENVNFIIHLNHYESVICCIFHFIYIPKLISMHFYIFMLFSYHMYSAIFVALTCIQLFLYYIHKWSWKTWDISAVISKLRKLLTIKMIQLKRILLKLQISFMK